MPHEVFAECQLLEDRRTPASLEAISPPFSKPTALLRLVLAVSRRPMASDLDVDRRGGWRSPAPGGRGDRPGGWKRPLAWAVAA